MSEILKIAAYQFPVIWESPQENLRRAEKAIDEFMGRLEPSMRPDIILLPEFFSFGFTMNPDCCEAENGPSLSWLQTISRKWDIVFGGSVPVATAEGRYNRFYFVFPSSEVEYYDKRHLFRMSGEDDVFSEGKYRKIVTYKGWNICLNVCYDLRFPIWSRNFGNTYDVMLNVASWPASRAEVADVLIRARAIENQAYYVFVNRCGSSPDTEYHGGSVVVDYKGRPVSDFVPDGSGEEGSGFVTASLDMEAMKAFRKKFPAWKDADFKNEINFI